MIPPDAAAPTVGAGPTLRNGSVIPIDVGPTLAEPARQSRGRMWQLFDDVRHRGFSYYIYRHRYLACFAVIGLMSILLELAVLQILPNWWPWAGQIVVAFFFSLAFSLVLNLTINFKVPRQYLLRTSAWFAAISLFSFALNTGIVSFLHATTEFTYSWLRLVSSGMFFVLAYTLHRTFTFNQSRNFGIAVYASEREDVSKVFEAVGHYCDHVHVDLVDETVLAGAAPVCLDRITEVRQYWRGFPICMHVMSRRPRQWVEQTWHQVDWYLFQCDSFDELMDLIFDCRRRAKKVGVVWHKDVPVGQLMPYLPHVDFVMVLGIAEPGKSGQILSEHGLAVAQTLEAMRPMYHYDLMFDGGVKATNVSRVPGRYIVSASGVLNADEPTSTADYLRMSRYCPEPTRRAA
jgi:pentose-5-phosphate-3-epimerase/membrane protein CcdC involved in cytochrome C biogenesis